MRLEPGRHDEPVTRCPVCGEIHMNPLIRRRAAEHRSMEAALVEAYQKIAALRCVIEGSARRAPFETMGEPPVKRGEEG